MSISYFLLFLLLRSSSAEFQETTVNFSISEDATAGTVVGTVPLVPERRYRISGTSPDFIVDLDTGQVTLSHVIDRERTNGSISFILFSTPPSIIHCVVNIEDVNDNSPSFPLPFQNVSIVETAMVGSRIPLIAASDPDAGANGTVSGYGILGGDHVFELTQENGVLYLELKKELDREDKHLYVYNVSATDGGHPARIGYTSIYVDVLDVNDNAPQFELKNTTVKWNGLQEYCIVSLSASDADSGPNGMISFSIPGPESKYFRMNGSELFAKHNQPTCCSRPPCSQCIVTVQATDRGSPTLSSSLTLTILLTTENQHDPVINIRLHPSHVDFAVIERDAVVGRTVAVLTVTDDDGPLGDSASLSIASGNEDGFFTLFTQQQFSILRLNRNATDMVLPFYELLFEAIDGQQPSRRSEKPLKVYLEAESSSIEVDRTLSASLTESLPVGSFVALVKTSSSGCTFNLTTQDPFEIDPVSGIVTTTSSLDIAVSDKYSLEVSVLPPPPSLKSILVNIDVTIVDVNNHAPEFVDLPSRIQVDENTEVGAVIVQLHTQDKDRGENAHVTTRVTNDAAKWVKIEKGSLVVLRPFDYETTKRIEVELSATDSGNPPLNRVAGLEIIVKDMNDHAPRFPCSEIYATVSSSSPRSSLVTTVYATDKDAGSYSTVTYRLLKISPSFTINSVTGDIRTNTILPEGKYEISVGAVDGGGILSSNNATVIVYSTSGLLPTFIDFPSKTEISEDAEVGDLVATVHGNGTKFVTASPFIEVDQYGVLSISREIPPRTEELNVTVIMEAGLTRVSQCIPVKINRKPPAPHFDVRSKQLKVDSDVMIGEELLKVKAGCDNCTYSTYCQSISVSPNGVITVKEHLEVDHNKCHLKVTDYLGRQDKMTLDISRKPNNQFLKLNSSYWFTVPENVVLGTVLGKLAHNAENYRFETNLATPIGVFPDGVLYVRRNIRRLDMEVITLPVTATHRIRGNVYSTIVNVLVEDVNDHAPSCPAQNQIYVKENMPVGTHLTTIKASDNDFGVNSMLSYRLLDPADKLFVEEATGKVYTLISFDFESYRSFNLSIQVTDHGTPKRTTTCEFGVEIGDENDNSPVFSHKSYSVDVDINGDFSTSPILRVSAADNDSKENGRIDYRLNNYFSMFRINSSTGEFSLKTRLRPYSLFNVSITAIDNGLPRRGVASFILVTTTTNHSRAPIFTENGPMRLSSFSSVGSIVGRMKATSDDVITFSTNDRRLDIDWLGHVILRERVDSLPASFDVIFTASTVHTNSSVIQHFVISASGAERFEVMENTAPLEVTSFLGNTSLWFVAPSSDAFVIRHNRLIVQKPLDRETHSEYQLVVLEEGSISTIRVAVGDVDDNSPRCGQKFFFLENFPANIRLTCQDDDQLDLAHNSNGLTYSMTSREGVRMSRDGWITVDEMNVLKLELDVQVYQSDATRRPTSVTVVLVKNIPDQSIVFPARGFSLLLSSSLGEGESFGRITAEAPSPLQYYVIGSNSIEVDRSSGELIVSRKVGGDLNLTLVAVSPNGIASVHVAVELIEDSLSLPSHSLLLSSPSLLPSTVVGSIDVGRDDVQFVLNDPYFYLRKHDVIVKKPIEQKELPYTLDVQVLKGRLSAVLKVCIVLQQTTKTEEINEIWVRENAPLGTVIGAVSTKDHYKVFPEVGLIIDGQGFIRTARRFDHEEESVIEFELHSTNGSIRQMVLLIDDENDNRPKIKHDVIEVEIAEDVEIGAEIARIEWSDRDLNNAFHFDIIEGNERGQFEMNADGILRVRDHLDRETSAKHRIVVSLMDGAAPFPFHIVNCTVLVTIGDVNDNAPIFTSSSHFLVEENSPRGKVIGTVSATDSDSGRNGRFSYRIFPSSLPFAELSVDPVLGYITVNSNIDFEQTRNLSFVLLITDFGAPSLTTEQLITVDVIDVNDNPPTFDKEPIIIQVNETVPRGSAIYRFVIYDSDSVANSLSLFQLEDGYGIFSVGPASGLLYVNSQLDYEKTTSHQLTVTVRNLVGGPIQKKNFTLEVNDLNDETPRFVAGCPVHFQVYENQAAPAVVGTTVSEDDDGGQNGLIAYSILEGNSTLFAINSSTGSIMSLMPLDRETTAEHRLTVQSADSGRPRLSNTCDILITVMDQNDNAPQFDQPYYIAQIKENGVVGQKVITVAANDRDGRENGRISYRIPDSSLPFAIDRKTGEVTVSSQIDREKRAKFEFEIEATDHGRFIRHRTTVPVTIVVEDENDNSPLIRNTQLDVFVRDDIQKGEVVYVVDGYDPDLGTIYYNISGADSYVFSINQNGEITSEVPSLASKSFYSITVGVFDEGGRNTSASFTFYVQQAQLFPRYHSDAKSVKLPEAAMVTVAICNAVSDKKSPANQIIYSVLAGNDGSFEIDALSGGLKTRSGLDRERKASYCLWVMASDSDNPPLSVIQRIDINVTDVNDNSPEFEKVIYRCNILENSEPQAIVKLRANDVDLRENGTVHYTITEGNEDDFFSIDESGRLRSERELDREYKSHYRLIVEARDGGSPVLASQAVVEVTVLDEDDNSPRFTHIFHENIPEDTAIGSPILIISASDADSLSNHTFHLENHQEVFEIDGVSGQISLKNQLDREMMDSYRLKVTVEDGSWNVHTTAKITVTDVNDNIPLFGEEEYVFLCKDLNLGRIHATDADSGLNGLVHYSMLHDSPYITIDTVTGQLVLLQEPTEAVTEVVVVAHDNGVPSQNAHVNVTIIWESLIEKKDTQTFVIPVNSSEGYPVGTLDVSNNVSLEMVSGNMVFLEDFGMVCLKKNISNYSNPSWVLVQEQHGSIYLLPIEIVQMENLMKPKFSEKRVRITVSETTLPGTEITRINASAGSSQMMRGIQYTASNSHPFEIRRDGTIYLISNIDFEQQRSYEVNVTASVGMMEDHAVLDIRILDDNDNPPVLLDRRRAYPVLSTDDVICVPFFDADSAPYDIIDYSTPDQNITIQSDTGCIIFAAGPSKEITITASNLEVSHTSVKVTVLKILSSRPPSGANSTVEVSENAMEGTILYTGNSSVYSVKRNETITDGAEIKTRGNLKRKPVNYTFFAKEPFERIASKFSVSLVPLPLAPSPVFPESQYFFNISEWSNGTVVHVFDITVPRDCSLHIPSTKTFCISPNGTLFVCDLPTSNSYTFEVEVHSKNRVVSHTTVRVTVSRKKITSFSPSIGFVRENSGATNILRVVPDIDFRENLRYSIADDALRKLFSLSEEGILSSLVPLDRERRSIYSIPIMAHAEKSKKRSTFHVRVFVDDVIDSPMLDERDILVTVVGDSSVSLGSVHPADLDSTREYQCSALSESGIRITTSCQLFIAGVASKASVRTKAVTNDTSVTYSVAYNALVVKKSQMESVIQFDFYASDDAVAEFMTAFREKYSDLTIFPVAVTSSSPFFHSLFLSLSDKKGNILPSTESLPVLRSFLSKSPPNYLEHVATVTGHCHNVTCPQEYHCTARVVSSQTRRSFRGSRSLWNIPAGQIQARCECRGPLCSKNCDCPNGICDKEGNCQNSTCTSHTCKNGNCVTGSCVCRSGYAGPDCSLTVDSTVSEVDSNPNTVPEGTCESFDCGAGQCVVVSGEQRCHCDGGFTSKYCGYASTVVALSNGHVTMLPTTWLRAQLAETRELDVQESCNGSQLVELSFRTEHDSGRLVTFDYGEMYAAIEISHSSVVFRVSDGYRNPIEIALAQIVDDGEWHALSLDLSRDRKTIIFQVDGIGKEAKSKVKLPALLSLSLQQIHIGWDGQNNRFPGCVRKVLFNKQLQLLEDGNSLKSQYFTSRVVGDTSVVCGRVAPSGLRPGAIAAAASAAVLLITVAIFYGLWKLILKNKQKTETGWKSAKEIDAFAMPKSSSHINHGMTSSMTSSRDSRIYEAADGYEMPMTTNHLRNYQRAPTLPAGQSPHIRTVADVVIEFPRSRPLPPSPLEGSHDRNQSNSEASTPPQTKPRSRAYQNEAYF